MNLSTRIAISSALLLIIIVLALIGGKNKVHSASVKMLTRSGIFAAISVILYIVPIFNLSLPIFPSFLKIHFDEIPAFIAGFAYGPVSACLVIVVKTLVKLPLTSTMGVGELADLIYSLAFVIPASIIYKKIHNFKGAVIGLLVSTTVQLVVSTFFTTFVILNFYMFVMGWNESLILMLCQKVNPAVNDLRFSFLFLVSLPFNALKDAIVVILTLILYKKTHKLIDKIGAEKN